MDFRGRILVALVTALCLVAALRSERVRGWGGFAPLVRVGQMSYSIFLVHFAVCLLVNAVVSHLWPASPVPNALGMLLAFVLSLAAGRLLYLRVEQHVPTWSTALRWQAGLVGAGLAKSPSALQLALAPLALPVQEPGHERQDQHRARNHPDEQVGAHGRCRPHHIAQMG
eukprot:gene39338-63006_t